MAKIEITYDDSGNVMLTDANGKTERFYCEYDVDERIIKKLNTICKFLPEEENG